MTLPNPSPTHGASGRHPSSSGPRRIGDYEVLEELGRGGAGVVYRGRHVTLGREVALKVLLAADLATPLQLQRFETEARAAARLRHPNIVTLHDAGVSSGKPFLVMDFVGGRSLEERLARDGPLPPREAARIVERLARALHYAHELLILHRDVKPANVLVGEGGEPLLTDFGLAKVGDAQGPTRSGSFLGTPSFAAPEQLMGRAQDRRADVYALGATLYALLAGSPPFSDEPRLENLVGAVLTREPPPPSAARGDRSDLPAIGRDLETICLKCLEKEPGARYASAADLADDLAREQRDEPVLARRPGTIERLARWRRHHRGAALVVVALPLVALVAGGGAAARGRLGAQRALSQQARGDAEAAWGALAAVGSAHPDRRTGLALRALHTAQRWRDLGLDVGDAGPAQLRAALALADVARETRQWSLAVEALALAGEANVDAERVAAARALLEGERRGEQERRQRRADALLDDAERGALAARPDGLLDGALELARLADDEVVARVVARLAAVTSRLREVEREVYASAGALDDDERALTLAPLAGVVEAHAEYVEHLALGRPLSATARATLVEAGRRLTVREERRRGAPQRPLDLIAARQSEVVGQGALDLARFAVEALGRLEPSDEVAAALEAYVLAEADELRALPAGLALCRLDAPRTRAAVALGQARFGANGTFTRQTSRWAEAAGEAFVSSGRESLGVSGTDAALPSELADTSRTLEANPRSAAAWNDRALARKAGGDQAGARADLERALELDPTLLAAWINLAELHLAAEDVLAASVAVEHALELDPRGRETLTSLGLLRSQQGRLSEARVALDGALERDPRYPLALNRRGTVRRRQRDLDGAKLDLEAALALSPEDPDLLSDLGLLMSERGDGRAAIALFDRALARAPRHLAALSNRASARQRIGDLRGARVDLELAREVAPGRAEVWNNLGTLAEAERDWRGAQDLYGRAVELRPTFALALHNRGRMRAEQGDQAGAIVDYDQALQVDARYADAINNRGLARLALGDADAALRDFSRALELEPDYLPGLVNRGDQLAKRGDVAGALRDLERFLALAPQHPVAPQVRSLVRRLRGD